MNYSGMASKVSSLNANLSDFINQMNSVDFSGEWTGNASTSIMEKMDSCSANAAKQTTCLTSFANALNYADLYQRAKEEKSSLVNLINSLNTAAEDYASNYEYYSNQMNNANTKMNDYKAKAISELGNVTAISSSISPISYSPNTDYQSTAKDVANNDVTLNVSSGTSAMSGAGVGAAVGAVSSATYSSSSPRYSSSSSYSYTPSYSSSSSSSSSSTSYRPTNRVVGDSVLDYSALGDKYTVVKTAKSVEEYLKVIESRGITQDSNSAIYGDSCLAFAYIHAYSMYSGNTSAGASNALQYTYANKFTGYTSDNKQDVLNKIYEEVNKGKPVVLQVNGNTSGTSRHYVTVVGFNKEVASGAALKEEDLLIIDSWDGALENMSSSTSRFMTTGAQTGKEYSGYQIYTIK